MNRTSKNATYMKQLEESKKKKHKSEKDIQNKVSKSLGKISGPVKCCEEIKLSKD